MLLVQNISCTNNAAFVMNFSIRWLDSDGNWHVTGWNSGNYPVGSTHTSPDLASIGVPTYAVAVTPYVHAILGGHEDGNTTVNYSADGATAKYNVRGVTVSFSVDFEN